MSTNGPSSWAAAKRRVLPRGGRVSLVVALYLLSHLFLDTVSKAFDIGSGVSVWYLPAALNLVLPFVFGLRYLPALFAAVLLAQLVNDPSLPLPSSLIHALTYSLVYGGAALFLRRLRVDPRLYRLRDVGWFMLIGTLVVPLVSSVVSVTNFSLFGLLEPSRWLTLVFQFAAGDATGVGALAPLLLVMLRYTSLSGLAVPGSNVPGSNVPGLDVPESKVPKSEVPESSGASREKPDERLPEELYEVDDPQAESQVAAWHPPGYKEVFRVLLFAGALALAAFLAYALPQSLTLDHSYITFVPLLFVAGWYGFAWGAAATFFMNVCIALFTFPKIGSVEGFALQFGLVTLTLLGILLGALVSERKRIAARLRHVAFHDALTGLPNRALFLERLEHAVERAEQGEGTIAVLFVDLDRFKGVNDGLGHAAGDTVLVEAARRLRRCLRPGDTVARLGGDEFTVLLKVNASQDDALQNAVGVAERIQEVFASPFHLRQAVQLGASVGVALSTTPYSRPEDLLRNADTALSRAKTQGRASYAVFDPDMYRGQLERLRLESELEGALERRELVVHYQPIVSLDAQGGAQKIVGAEALVRWQHPERGPVPPDAFIPVAEAAGLIIPLGVWMMEQVFAQTKAWHDAGHTQLYTSVNVSARQAQHPQLVDAVLGLLERLRLPPSCVALELTESVFMEGVGENVTRFTELHRAGVRLSIDDFGTGYSSLSRLKSLPVHTLKIDRSFLRDAPENASDAAIVKTILAMAHNLNLNVVAEGVERAAQADFLRTHGCNQAQGYLFGYPVPADVFARLLT